VQNEPTARDKRASVPKIGMLMNRFDSHPERGAGRNRAGIDAAPSEWARLIALTENSDRFDLKWNRAILS
jgi:hypothetical protein